MIARPRVVIVGGGFGGLTAARALRKAPVDITLLDKSNHHTFQPLLYQVATASLAPNDITAPIRWLLRRQANTTVLLAEALSIDPERRVVRINVEPVEVPYDYLILAAGARHSYFGHDEWESAAPGLKAVEDALEIRRRFLGAFERAEGSPDASERRAFLTFVIVGGGPTGVELAGAIPLIAKRALRRDFRHIDTEETRVILLEGGDRLLPSYPPNLSEQARIDLQALGVDVRTSAMVTGVDPEGVTVKEGGVEHRIYARTVFWAAGNAASPIAKCIGAPLDNAGRVLVEPDLSAPGRPEIFVIGDLARLYQDKKPIPWVAAAANQEGEAAAANIVRSIKGEPRRPFHYVNKGDMATIGRNRAVADFGRVQIHGRLAWWLWLFVHILFLTGFRNRLSVLLSWAYAYFTYRRGVRLILDVDPRSMEAKATKELPCKVMADLDDGRGARIAAASAPER